MKHSAGKYRSSSVLVVTRRRHSFHGCSHSALAEPEQRGVATNTNRGSKLTALAFHFIFVTTVCGSLYFGRFHVFGAPHSNRSFNHSQPHFTRTGADRIAAVLLRLIWKRQPRTIDH